MGTKSLEYRPMKKTTVEFHTDCIELESGPFRIAVTTRVGPRVIGAFVENSPNLFRVMPDEPLPNCPTGFKLYGGHRLWHSPEAMPRTYAPDNAPVTVQETSAGIMFSSGIEKDTGIEKSITIQPLGQARFRLVHRLTNRTPWEIELAPWALSVMAPGGVAVLPLKRDPKANPLAPDRFVIAWPYTDLDDPRLTFGREFVLLRQDSSAAQPCKIGVNGERGWIAYVNAGTALVKFYEPIAGADYPDNGCSIESYSCADFCEIETLGPLQLLEPGETARHVETWQAFAGLGPITSEEDVSRELLPRITP